MEIVFQTGILKINFEPTLSFAVKLEVDTNVDHKYIRKKTHNDTKCSWTTED